MSTRTTFNKRPGTTDKGKSYEDIVAAHFALKFALQKDVQDFTISSNDDDFGDFDDVVMDLSLRSNEHVKYALQLKHSQQNKPLMSEALTEINGDYSLQKYCKQFTDNLVSSGHRTYIYVLYTNRPLKLSNKDLQLKGKKHFTVKIHEEQPPCAVIATSKNGMQYRCEISASEGTLLDDEATEEFKQYEEFFKNFLVCTGQGDVPGIEAIISKTLEDEFGCKDESYLEFVRKWSLRDNEKLVLNKETVKFKLGECLLSPYCLEHVIGPDIEQGRWEIFKETMMQFDVTILQTGKNWRQRYGVDLNHLDRDAVEKTGIRFELSSEESKEKLKIFEEKTCEEKSLLQSVVRSKIIDLDAYLSDTSRNQSEEIDKMVLVTSHLCVTNKELEKIAARNPYKACHHVRLVDVNKLEVIREGSIDHLKEFRLGNEESTIKEIEILKSEHVVNIVCSAPGMGKSVLMKYLKVNYSSEYWVTYIDLKLHYSKFTSSDSCETILNYVVNIGSDEYSALDKNIKRSFQDQKKLILLWDALDEVPADYVGVITDAVLKLKDCGIRQWIASRPHLQTLLENKFNRFAFSIVELSKVQRDDYIHRRLDENKAKKLQKEMGRMHSGFLGVPLLLFILTELFLKKKGEWNFTSGMARSALYRYFIEEQFKAYYAKTECNLTNHIMKDILDEHRSNRLEQYELMGALSCFGEGALKKKNKWLKIVQKFVSDGVGIITDVRNGSPVFFHRTFGEYFAACWLTKNSSKLANFAELIFQEEFRGVRFMMDSILAEDCPAHLAVLHQDLDELKKCSREICSEKDKGGRNVLQILSSWGRTYPPLKVEELVDSYLVDYTPSIGILALFQQQKSMKLPCRLEDVVYEKLCKFLIQSDWNDPLHKDTLFGWNTFAYADAALCLYPFEVLLSKKYKINLSSLKHFSDICTVTFYSIICEYQRLFGTIDSIPRIQFTNGENLMHSAITFGNCNCLLKILTLDFYRHGVNNFAPLIKSSQLFQWCFNYFHQLRIKCPYKTTDETNSPVPFGLTPLHMATLEGDLDKVRILVKHKAVVDKWNRHYQVTPLQFAATQGNVEIVKYLIAKGAKPNICNLSGFKTLHLAAFHGHLEVMKFLISKKICKVDCKARYYGITPLHVAAANGQFRSIEYLVREGAHFDAKINYVPTSLKLHCFRGWTYTETNTDIVQTKINCILQKRQRQKFGATSLHFASGNGNITAVKFLVKQGCSVIAENISKRLPISYAVEGRHRKTVEYLVRECGNASQLGGINEQNIFGQTCLHEAILKKDFEMTELLVKLGADLEKTDYDEGRTALLLSAVVNSVGILKMLIKNGANIHAVNDQGCNCFQIAAACNNIDVFNYLRANGFSMRIKTKLERNLLHVAAMGGSFEIAELLIKDEVFDINQPDKNGLVPLHFVVDHLNKKNCFSKDALKLLSLLLEYNADVNAGTSCNTAPPLLFAFTGENFNSEVVKLLVQNRAETNIKDQNGIFPLLVCTKNRNLETVQLLLKFEANPYMSDKAGNNCLHYACLLGYTEIVEMLLKYTDPNVRNHKGQTPLHLACAKANLEIIRALVEKGAQPDIEDQYCNTATYLLLRAVDKATARRSCAPY